jgi:cytochrome c oxidase subunit 2
MSLSHTARNLGHAIRTFGLAAALAFAPQAMAAAAAPAAAPAVAAPAAPLTVSPAPAGAASDVAAPAPVDKGSYTPMKPIAGKGQPVAGGYTFQDQYSDTGREALAMHDYLLMPVITVITLFVLLLLLLVMVRFRRGANPVASKTSHNTFIEIIWTVIPVLILVVIAVPSIRLLAHQYKPAPKGALTVKATGYQWYWGYTYPDNGGFEVISNILPDAEALKRGEQPQLAADNRMVVPVGEPIRMQTTGSDVIHAFAVPSLWFKLDAVPGRINEKVLFIKEPGVYYGQCSELCGARHGYMPIVVEALPRAKFEEWVKTQGGTVGAAAATTTAASPAKTAPAA